jgi:hypothetical protein
VSRLWEVVSILEALTGFLVMGTSVTYIIAVFEGVDRRDARALQVYSETSGTWDGAEIINRSLKHGDVDALRRRLEEWAFLVRDLHGRLYRFHGLALYVRTHGLDFGPERTLHTLCDVGLRAKVLATSPRMGRIRQSADQLALSLDHFAKAMIRRNGSKVAREAMEAAEPTDGDRAHVQAVWDEVSAFHYLETPQVPLAENRELLHLAARLRVFLEDLERLTMWRKLQTHDPAKRDHDAL